MTYVVSNLTIVYDDTTSTALEPAYVFSKEKVRKYLKENPFPESESNSYSEKDLLCDIECSGIWVLPEDLTREQKEFIEELVDHFL